MKVKTKSGFKCDVNERIINDWRFIRALANADSKDESKQLAGLTQIVTLLLGENGEDALCAHLERDGIVSTAEFYQIVVEIIQSIREQNESAKNSMSSPR